MSRKLVLALALTLLVGMLSVAFNVQRAKASGTIYIRADGSIEGTDKIHRDGDVYTFTDNIYDEIRVERSNIIIDGNGYTLRGNGSGCGFNLTSNVYSIDLSTRISNLTIKNTNIRNFNYGIRLYASSNNRISGNTITNNSIGIELGESSNYNSISGNNITDNDDGIELGSVNNSVSGNSITNSNYEGMRLYASFNIISGNLFTNDGLVVESSGNVVADNFVNGKPLVYLEGISHQSVGEAGQVILVNCEDVQVKNLNLSHTTVGIELRNTNNTIISGNNITANNQHGIVLSESSNNNSISENRIANNNESGIWLNGGSNNSIVGNNVTANKRTGVEIYSSNTMIISGNNITNNAVGILGIFSNNTISGNNITNNSDRGIYLQDSLNNSISGNNITANSRDGIFLFYYSKYNSVSGNNITNNGVGTLGGSGIYLHTSSNNSICGNTITNNRGSGIYLSGGSNYLEVYSNNSINGNIITNNSEGIYLYGSMNHNSIAENNITNNSYGIRFWDRQSSNNLIYHNNFIKNTKQVSMFFPGEYPANTWDDGYPSGGNYWSDYLAKYPNAMEIDHTGIGDTPYVIDENNTDHYPLMNQIIINEFPTFAFLTIFLTVTLLTAFASRWRRNKSAR